MRILLATVALLLAVTGVAEAKAFRGETSQGRYASVVVGDDDQVVRIRISYRAPCVSDDEVRFANVMRLEPPYEEASPDEVVEEIEVRERLGGGGRNRQTATVTARREVAEDGTESWSGTFRTRAVLFRKGRWMDTCELRRVTWTATAVSSA